MANDSIFPNVQSDIQGGYPTVTVANPKGNCLGSITITGLNANQDPMISGIKNKYKAQLIQATGWKDLDMTVVQVNANTWEIYVV